MGHYMDQIKASHDTFEQLRYDEDADWSSQTFHLHQATLDEDDLEEYVANAESLLLFTEDMQAAEKKAFAAAMTGAKLVKKQRQEAVVLSKMDGERSTKAAVALTYKTGDGEVDIYFTYFSGVAPACTGTSAEMVRDWSKYLLYKELSKHGLLTW